MDSLTADEIKALPYEWNDFWARKDQVAPGPIMKSGVAWLVWLVLAGRGFGKTRTGAEFIRDAIEHGGYQRAAIVGPTSRDVRKVMIEGESGLLSVCPPWNRPRYEPSNLRLVWPSGAEAHLYTADEPERLRGPQHDIAWCDELCSWRYPEAWDMLMFGMRLGNPRMCVTTTPKPIKLLRELIASASTAVTRGSTYDNRDNLAPAFFTNVVSKYEGTRLGRQELKAEILDDVPGALWTYALIESTRKRLDQLPGISQNVEQERIKRIRNCMTRIVVAIDPSGTSGPRSKSNQQGLVVTEESKANDVGIIVCGKGIDGHGYVLEDLTINAPPSVWGSRAVEAYHRWMADRIIAERNFGGAMVEFVIRAADRKVAYKEVNASRGKSVRAEPIASLYQKTTQREAMIHHVGAFPELETQLTMMTSNGYTGDGSPDRLDALVWGMTELMLVGLLPPPAIVIKASFTR